MTPKIRESIGLNQPHFGRRIRNLLLTGAAMVSALIVLLGAMSPVIRPYAKVVIVSTLDSTYVLQQTYGRRTLTDSLKHDRELERIDARLAAVDTIKMCIRRHRPAWCE